MPPILFYPIITISKTWYWLWHEGCSLDFLQKYVVDMWVYGYCVFTGFLFNERVVHDRLIFFMNDYILFFNTSTGMFMLFNITLSVLVVMNLSLLFFF